MEIRLKIRPGSTKSNVVMFDTTSKNASSSPKYTDSLRLSSEGNLSIGRLRVVRLQVQIRMRASEWSWSGAPIWFWGDRSVEFQFNLTSATNFWCSSDRPKNTLKVTKSLATLPYTESELRSWRQFKSGARSSSFESEGFGLQDACQIRKEHVLSARLSVQIQSDAFTTERPLKRSPLFLYLDFYS